MDVGDSGLVLFELSRHLPSAQLPSSPRYRRPSTQLSSNGSGVDDRDREDPGNGLSLGYNSHSFLGRIAGALMSRLGVEGFGYSPLDQSGE